MESWIISGLFGALFIGIFSFATKIASEKKLDEDLFLFSVYFFGSIWTFIMLFFFGEFKITWTVFILSLIMGFGYPFVLRTRMVSLRHLTASTYFINYRILSSTLLIFIGMIVFSEKITYYQIIGILVGFVVFYLLLEKKRVNEKNVDFRKGVIYLLYGVGIVAFLHVIAKYNALVNGNFHMYNFLCFLFGMISFFVSNFSVIKKVNRQTKDLKFIIWFSIVAGFFFATNGWFLYYAYVVGNLAIVYKIISYSLFVPVILSIIIYREKISVKKIIAFFLTAISIWLFTL